MPKSYGKSVVGTGGINGDSFYISSDNSTFVLADGASGAGNDGKVIMSKLCTQMIEDNPFSSACLSVRDYLDKMIWSINNKLIFVSQKNRSYIFGTLIICVVQNNTATIVSIGDSSAYYIHKNSVLSVAKTKKTYQGLIGAGIYTEEQLEQAVRKLPEHMWSMFDCFIPSVVPNYSIEEIALASGDMIVLCCDGISDYVEPAYIAEILHSDSLSESVDALINTAKQRSISQREYHDDLTVVAYCH